MLKPFEDRDLEGCKKIYTGGPRLMRMSLLRISLLRISLLWTNIEKIAVTNYCGPKNRIRERPLMTFNFRVGRDPK